MKEIKLSLIKGEGKNFPFKDVMNALTCTINYGRKEFMRKWKNCDSIVVCLTFHKDTRKQLKPKELKKLLKSLDKK